MQFLYRPGHGIFTPSKKSTVVEVLGKPSKNGGNCYGAIAARLRAESLVGYKSRPVFGLPSAFLEPPMKKRVSLLTALLLPVFAALAFADSTTAVLASLRDLESSVRSSGSRLSETDTREVLDLLAQAKEIVGRAGSGNAGACFNEAYRTLSRDEATELCQGGGTVDTAQCYVDAYRTLSKRESIDLCKNRGSRRAAACYVNAYRTLSKKESLDLCSDRGTEATAECYVEAYRTLNKSESLRLCRAGGSKERVACYQEAYRSNSKEQSLNLCAPN